MTRSHRQLILLYDSTCSMCSRVADAATEGSAELSVRGLQDPQMRELLSSAGCPELFEPALLEVSDHSVAVHTRFRLRSRLARHVGLRDSFRIMHAMVDSVAPAADPSRRRFLSIAGVLGAATVVLPWVSARPVVPDPRMGP